ncbi:MAG TPA: hypothetical protein DCS82_05330 [Rhodospirillaceae bacterium]|nr:hypothetical protein [Rhodospirillaceae bacterium]HAT35116.1 hypothetical protein [Rhodospirillaceae bacterium]
MSTDSHLVIIPPGLGLISGSQRGVTFFTVLDWPTSKYLKKSMPTASDETWLDRRCDHLEPFFT